MGRKRLEEKSIRKLQKNGGSVVVSIPVDELRKLKWRSGQKVVVKRKGCMIVIADWEYIKKR